MNRTNFIPLLIILTTIVSMQPPFASAQTMCRVVNVRFHPPETAHPGEVIQIGAIVTASCFYYSSVIVDLVDSRSGMILTRTFWPYAPLSNPVSPLLVNNLLVRDQLGYWPLTLLVYFAGSSTGIQFTIFVEPHT